MRWVVVWFAVGMAAFGIALSVAYAPQANAEVSAECWAHLSDKKTAVTPAADRRYHLERGEPSPCTEKDAAEGSTARESKPKHEQKSRFCRKRWYC